MTFKIEYNSSVTQYLQRIIFPRDMLETPENMIWCPLSKLESTQEFQKFAASGEPRTNVRGHGAWVTPVVVDGFLDVGWNSYNSNGERRRKQ